MVSARGETFKPDAPECVAGLTRHRRQVPSIMTRGQGYASRERGRTHLRVRPRRAGLTGPRPPRRRESMSAEREHRIHENLQSL